MGGVVIYGDDVRAEILRRLACGETLSAICRRPGMPDRDTVYQWQEKDEEFSRQFARARMIGFDAIADETKEISDMPPAYTADGKIDQGDVQNRKLQIWTRQQLLAKWDPKRYGDRQQVEHSGSIGLESLVTGSAEKK